MAMDVSSLHSGLDAVHPCRPPRGKLHVDNYIRASYLSEDELQEWIRNNWQNYAYRHMHGLLAQATGATNSRYACMCLSIRLANCAFVLRLRRIHHRTAYI